MDLQDVGYGGMDWIELAQLHQMQPAPLLPVTTITTLRLDDERIKSSIPDRRKESFVLSTASRMAPVPTRNPIQ